MRLITIILSLFLCVDTSHGYCEKSTLAIDTAKHIVKKQYKKLTDWPRPRRSPPPDKIYYNDCVFTHRYTIAQQLRKYPFSKAAKILAVSYDGTAEPNTPIVLVNGDTIDAVTQKKFVKSKNKPHGLYFKEDTLDYISLFEIKELTPEQINRLTNILYNTDVKIHNDYAYPAYSCFNPRNALVFFDKDGKVFDYVEVCFECKRTRSKSDKIFLGSACNQSLNFVKKYLIDLGIKYGTLTTKYPE
jgi:hypothetical protein